MINIKQDIMALKDEKYREFQCMLCPGTSNIIGIRMPVLRKYAKKIKEEVDINSIPNDYYEEIMLKGMLIGMQKELDFEKIINYIPLINSRAICDVFCAGLKITEKNKERVWNFLKEHLKSNKEFELRFALVMILDFYIDEKYIDEVLEIIDSIKSDEYYVQMAAAWALSVCVVKFYEKTLEYLKNSSIDKFTFNKAIQKSIESYRITEGQKEILKKMKKI